jgi:hypothetical protein
VIYSDDEHEDSLFSCVNWLLLALCVDSIHEDNGDP